MSRVKDPMTGEVKPKGVTSFTPPADAIQGAPLVQASSYSSRVQQKRQAVEAAKSRNVPLGHAEPIPEGKLQPIIDAARSSELPQPDWGGMEDIANGQDPAEEEWSAPPSAPPPPQAKGVGAGVGVNQAVASNTGRPLNMRQAKELAAEEMRKREQFEKQAQAQAEAEAEEEAEAAVQERMDDADGDLVQGPLSYFDPEAFREAQIPLLKKERREKIEKRVPPLQFEDLIIKREVKQTVTVIPGKFSLGLRTVKEREHLWILQYLYETTGVSSPAYIDELNSVCRIACSVWSINGKPLPEFRDNVGQMNEAIDKEKFEKKLEIILDHPTMVVADMGVQYNWFSDRVTSLFSLDELKNG